MTEKEGIMPTRSAVVASMEVGGIAVCVESPATPDLAARTGKTPATPATLEGDCLRIEDDSAVRSPAEIAKVFSGTSENGTNSLQRKDRPHRPDGATVVVDSRGRARIIRNDRLHEGDGT